MKGKKSSHLYQFDGGPFEFHVFHQKFFFSTNTGDKQQWLNWLVSFTNIGPDAESIYCSGNTVISLQPVGHLSHHPIWAAMWSIINYRRERKRRVKAATILFIWMIFLGSVCQQCFQCKLIWFIQCRLFIGVFYLPRRPCRI